MTLVVRSKRRNSFGRFYRGCCSCCSFAASPPIGSLCHRSPYRPTRLANPRFSRGRNWWCCRLALRMQTEISFPGLNEQDFRVYEDGQLQRVTSFQEGDTPVTVGLIVDHSRSMGPKLPEVAAAVSAFAQSSNSQDEMFVVDFNDDVSVELMDGKAFTSDPKELAKAVFSCPGARDEPRSTMRWPKGSSTCSSAIGTKKL